MAENIAIKVENVSKNFRLPHERVDSVKNLFVNPFQKRLKNDGETQHALRNISFEVKEGEFFGIVGRNGSGKSTLLKLIAGIYQPNKGSITINGRLVPFIELGVGFNPELTGRENIYLNGALLGLTKKQIDKQYHNIVEFAELERFIDQKLKNYSSGMQVRLAFSMATRAEADILLVDEVLAVGDADFQRKCFDYFKTLKRSKKTVVFVSHDMSSVRQYCDRVVLIEKSELVSEGPAAEVATEYTKMFSTNTEETDDGEKNKRWGNKSLVISNVKLSTTALTKTTDELKITTTIVSKQDMSAPVIGFVVKNTETGVEILGTNTKIETVKTGVWQKDTPRTVEWTLPNVFADGGYQVDVAVLEDDGVTVADWWEGVAKFKSFEEVPSPYVVKPIITTVLK